MNNKCCQICFILLPNFLLWIEKINIQKLVTHVTDCLSGVKYLYVWYTTAPVNFNAPGQPGARPVTPTTGIWLRALTKIVLAANFKQKIFCFKFYFKYVNVFMFFYFALKNFIRRVFFFLKLVTWLFSQNDNSLFNHHFETQHFLNVLFADVWLF